LSSVCSQLHLAFVVDFHVLMLLTGNFIEYSFLWFLFWFIAADTIPMN